MITLNDLKFSYTPSATYKESVHASAENLIKDGYEILCEGYLYYRNRKNKLKDGTISSINWRCKEDACKSSLTIGFTDGIPTRFVPHEQYTGDKNAENVHRPMNEAELACHNFTKIVKIRSSTEEMPAKRIYEEENEKLIASGIDAEELQPYHPQFHEISSCLQKRRSKVRPRLPKCIKDILLTGEYEQTSDGKPFIILKTKNNT